MDTGSMPLRAARSRLLNPARFRASESKVVMEMLERRLMFSTVIYSNDFQNAVGSEWSKTITDTTPSGRKFLGQFSGGNNGFMNGGATWTTGRSGRNSAVALDGSTGYVTIGSDDTLVHLSSAATVSVWVKFNSVSGTPIILDTEGAGASPGPGFQLGIDSGKLYFEVRSSAGTAYNNKSASGGTTLTTGTWYQLTGTFSGGTVTTYVNGTQDRQATPGGTLDTLSPPVIGKRKGGTGSGAKWLSGTVDDLQIFNRALSSTDVSSLPDGTSDGLITYLKMDENTGTRLQDTSGASGVKLSLGSIPTHSQLTVSFDLFVIHSWDGRSTGIYGPDIWTLTEDGSTLLNTTFANGNVSGQSYPGSYPGGNHPKQTGASEVDTLGYGSPSDSVYHLSYTFSHTSSSVVLYFNASNLQGLDDESWGIDNLSVSRDTDSTVSSSVDLTLDGIAPGAEETVARDLKLNDDYDEGNHNASGTPVSDLEPDASAGDRIVPSDDELVDGTLTLSQDEGTGGAWRLTFPSSLKIWMDAGSGDWIPVMSGQWSPAIFGQQTLALKLEGVALSSTLSDLDIAAAFTSASTTSTHDALVSVLPRVPPSPQDLTAATNDSNLTSLTWSAPTGLGFGGDYNVYRSTGGGDYIKLNNLPLKDTSFVDSDVPAGVLASYRVTLLDWDGAESAPASTTAARPVDTTAPNSPTSVSANATDTGVELGWSSSTSADVVLYRVYFADQQDDPTDSIGSVDASGGTSESFFEDSGLGGQEIEYAITAVDAAGNESSPSTVTVETMPVDMSPPAAPTGVTVSRDTAGAYTITWDANSDADLEGYRVYRSDDLPPLLVPVSGDPISGTSFVDNTVSFDESAYYFVSAIDHHGNESVASGVDETAPSTPASLSASDDAGGVTLSWTGVSDTDLLRYRILKSDSATGTFDPVGSVDAGTETYFDPTAVEGSTIYYRVIAEDDSGNLALPITTSVNRSISTPTGFSAALASSSEVNLDWDGTWVPGITWNVYRDASASFTPSSSNLIANNVDVNQYVDASLASWTTFYYKVIAVSDTTMSAATAAVEVQNTTVSVPDAPLFGEINPTTNDGELELHWDNSILNETGYVIERFNPTSNSWDTLGTRGVNANSYLVTGINLLDDQLYRVSATNSAGTGEALELSWTAS